MDTMAAIRPTRRRRKTQWWKSFASPRLMLLAAPILLGPIAALIMFEDEVALSPIDLAIVSLPTAGDAAGGGSSTALLGSAASKLPNNVSLPLFANSARAAATRLARSDAGVAAGDADLDFASAEFAMLHPRTLAKEDLLIGSLAMVYSTPMNMDLSLKLFEEFCNASPEDPFYHVSMTALPIDPNLRLALERYSTTATKGGPFCARLFRDDL